MAYSHAVLEHVRHVRIVVAAWYPVAVPGVLGAGLATGAPRRRGTGRGVVFEIPLRQLEDIEVFALQLLHADVGGDLDEVAVRLGVIPANHANLVVELRGAHEVLDNHDGARESFAYPVFGCGRRCRGAAGAVAARVAVEPGGGRRVAPANAIARSCVPGGGIVACGSATAGGATGRTGRVGVQQRRRLRLVGLPGRRLGGLAGDVVLRRLSVGARLLCFGGLARQALLFLLFFLLVGLHDAVHSGDARAAHGSGEFRLRLSHVYVALHLCEHPPEHPAGDELTGAVGVDPADDAEHLRPAGRLRQLGDVGPLLRLPRLPGLGQVRVGDADHWREALGEAQCEPHLALALGCLHPLLGPVHLQHVYRRWLVLAPREHIAEKGLDVAVDVLCQPQAPYEGLEVVGAEERCEEYHRFDLWKPRCSTILPLLVVGATPVGVAQDAVCVTHGLELPR
mmetsp:Transcript_1029/g.2930  ORF Transcript_1029/g.2930 Transcript_1029/m.2930 type:complete len:453 (-) Transcript_1029:684-2042(-)